MHFSTVNIFQKFNKSGNFWKRKISSFMLYTPSLHVVVAFAFQAWYSGFRAEGKLRWTARSTRCSTWRFSTGSASSRRQVRVFITSLMPNTSCRVLQTFDSWFYEKSFMWFRYPVLLRTISGKKIHFSGNKFLVFNFLFTSWKDNKLQMFLSQNE